MKRDVGKVLALGLVLLAANLAQASPWPTTEGGHVEGDYSAGFMAEWWYLNVKATVMSTKGEKRDISFLAVVAHQESPMIAVNGEQYSHLIHFDATYLENNTNNFQFTDTLVPRTSLTSYIDLHTPYVRYDYPDGTAKLFGSAPFGYAMTYQTSSLSFQVYFKPETVETVDQATAPLSFNTYEKSYGRALGAVKINGKQYFIIKAEGYFDHMIPVSNVGTWAMSMHGWSWLEVTTPKYQAVVYAIRGLQDGYDNYSFRHLTLLDKHTGKVIGQYSGSQVTITETGWVNEPSTSRKRPQQISVSAGNVTVTTTSGNMATFNYSMANATGFVDFMGHQTTGAQITVNGCTQTGSGFFEYLVSDFGLLQPAP